MRTAALTLALAASLAACKQDNTELERKVDKLTQMVQAMDAKVGAGGGAARPARPRRPEPDPKDVYAIPVEGSPTSGPDDALVTVVEGFEYACPACLGARPVVAALKEKYGNKIRVVYKQYIVHPDQATTAANAICAANLQGKFTEMDKVLWEKGFNGGRDFSPPKLEAYATEAGLDLARFKADLNGPCVQRVQREHAELQSFGQGATPTFYVNGRYNVGAGKQKLEQLIDEELALAEKRVKEGTKPSEYYKTWILEKGLKKFEPKAT